MQRSVIIISSFFIGLLACSTQGNAVLYPTDTPAFETPGGTFQTYFDNMYTTVQCNTTLQVVAGFSPTGVPICVTPTAAGFSLLGQTSGDTVRYNGTDWIRTDFLYNNGTNIGIGTQTPTAMLDINGQIRIAGGSPGIGKLLMSDATGIASWHDPLPSLSGSFWSVGGNTFSATQNLGTISNHVLPIITNNIERMRIDTAGNVGIGTATPGARLEVAGQLKITGGGIGSGKFLVSDATGLASWTDIIPATSFSISGSTLGDTLYYNGSDWVRTNNIFHTGGNVGIGTTLPGSKLEVAGQLKITGGSPAAGYVLTSDATGLASWQMPVVSGIAGGQPNYIARWLTNTTLGTGSIYDDGTNVGIGTNTPAGKFEVWDGAMSIFHARGLANFGVGAYASNHLGTGGNNLGIGNFSLYSRTTAWNNLAYGGQALYANTTGNANQAFGELALRNNISGSNNIANGYGALYSNTVGENNIAVGVTALYSNTTGNDNIANGAWALYYNSTGAYNTAIGRQSLRYNTTGSNNVAVGIQSLEDNTTGASNVSIGNEVLANIATGSYNTAIGINAANLLTSGDNNIAIGYDVNLTSSTGSNQLNIGNWIYGSGGSIGIGATNPTAKLEVAGQLKITGGSPGSGKILTSDATGLATWSDGFSGTTDATGIVGGTGSQNYLSKFGTGGIGLFVSQVFDNGTNVGIGTSSPNEKLHINGNSIIGSAAPVNIPTAPLRLINSSAGVMRTQLSLINTGGGGGAGSAIDFFTYDVGGGTDPGLRIGGVDSNYSAHFTVSTKNPGAAANTLMERFRITSDGDAGIGTMNPGAKLEVAGQVKITGGSPGLGKILTSDASGLATWAAGFSGSITASGITGGTQNYVTKFGTGGNGLVNSLIYDTGTGVIIGGTSVGSRFEIWNGAVSIFHLRGNNIGLGASATRYQTSGSANVGIGSNSLRSLTTGYNNAAFGDSALYGNNAGYFNAGIGTQALYSNSIGNWNSALGTQSLWTNLDGSYNVAFGGQSLYSNLTGNNSVAIGYQALRASLASGNVGIGYMAGSGITTGTNNIVIGTNAGAISNTASNQLNIGNWIYGANGNIGIGTGTSLTTRLVVDSGINNTIGIRVPRVNNNSPVYTGAAVGLGIDAAGNLVPVSNGDVVVYDALGRNNAAPVPDPDIAGRRIRYDFNKYFQLPTKQSFVVSDGDGAGFNAPYFKEDGVSGLCSYNGAGGSSPYDCAIADPVTGLSASPNNSFTMTARGDNYGYQIALGARGDAPLFARSGRWYNGGTNYGSGLYLANGTTPTPWQKVLTVPANHIEYFYVNIGYNSQLQEISGGGNIGMGTSNPDMRLVLAYSGTTGSTKELMRIQRGVQGTDANMVNAFGTPYLMIGGQEKRTNSIQTLGFGYTSAQSAQPVEIGLITTNTTGNTLGDLVFATRSVTTNTAPTERMRIGSNGNIAIGTGNTSGVAKLKIDGQIQITGGGVSSGHVLVTDNTGLGYWRDVATLGVGGFNYNAASDYSSLNTIEVAYDKTDMVFQLADNATDDGDRFIFQQDQWSGVNDQRYPLVMNGRYAAFDPRYSLNYNSSTSIYATGNLLNATAYMDYVNRRFGIGTINPSDTLHVNGTFRLVDGTQGAGKVLTSDANGVASWQTPSGGGGGGSNYTSVLTSAATRNSNSLGDLGLSSPSLPTGYYNFRFTAKFRSTATTNGIGLALAANGATVTNYAGRLQAQVTANTIQVYSNGTIGSTALTSTAVPAANTDYVATFDGIFQVTATGSVKMQFRSEVNGQTVTIQPGSNLSIEPL